MLSHHAMPDFQCRTTCNHRECQRHAPLGFIDRTAECSCLGDVNASSIFLENVLDLSNTLAQIMIICGIHECKAKSTIEVATYAFLHYDQVCYCLDDVPKKRLRKEDLFHELGRKCLMNRVEAHLAYTIIKRGFKAFYYKPREDDLTNVLNLQTQFSDECVYVHAAKKTAESYARYDGLSCQEQRGFEAKIKVVYKKFYDRMQTRKTKPVGDDCNCCFCAKKRGHLVYGKEPPCSSRKPEKHICPHCCKKKIKRKMVHPSRMMPKCPKCHRSKKFCICEKYKFDLNWVKSIWYRDDMDLYYREQIEENEEREKAKCADQTSAERLAAETGSKPVSPTGSRISGQGSPPRSKPSSIEAMQTSAAVEEQQQQQQAEGEEEAPKPAEETAEG